MQLRVLVIDAHPAIGLGLVQLVGIMPGIEVCGLAARGCDGVECAGLIRPDVALVDAELAGEAAPDTIRAIRAHLPTTRVVALGLYPGRRAAMLAAGAHAFVLKDAGYDALRAAIVAENDSVTGHALRPVSTTGRPPATADHLATDQASASTWMPRSEHR